MSAVFNSLAFCMYTCNEALSQPKGRASKTDCAINNKWGECLSIIAIIESDGERLSETVSAALRKSGMGGVTILGKAALQNGVTPELVVVSKSVSSLDRQVNCRTLLAPGGAKKLMKSINADSVISYGLSDRDSLTLSSIGDDAIVLALQREISTLGGVTLDRQELPVRRKTGVTDESMLGAAGTLLILGLNPNDLY